MLIDRQVTGKLELESEIEQLWLEEAVRRHDEVAFGEVETVTMEGAFGKARAACG